MEDTVPRDDESPETVVIFGGRSEIGSELALRLARGAAVILAVRGGGSLDQQVSALHAAGAVTVHVKAFDADDLASHGVVLDELITEHGPIGTAVLAFGLLGDHSVPKPTPGTRSPSCTPTTSPR